MCGTLEFVKKHVQFKTDQRAIFCFSLAAAPPPPHHPLSPQATSNEHSQSSILPPPPPLLFRRLLPNTRPIHHTQHAARGPSSSPTGRRKIDLFVCRERGANKKGKALMGGDEHCYRGVRVVLPPVCVVLPPVCVCRRLTPPVIQTNGYTTTAVCVCVCVRSQTMFTHLSRLPFISSIFNLVCTMGPK